MVTLMSNLDGAAGVIGRCNAKDVPTPNSSHSVNHIQKVIAGLTNQLRRIQTSCTDVNQLGKHQSNPKSLDRALHMATALTHTSIVKIMHSIQSACLSANDDTEYYTNIDTVMRAKRETHNMIISTLDKADSTLVVM